MSTPEKQAVVQDLAELFRSRPGIYLADFRGLNVEAISLLRRKCRREGVEFRVVKNRLVKRAVADTDASGVLPYLTGPTALASSEGDPAIPARVLKEFVDEYEKPEIKAGLIDGRVLTAAEVWRIATLPSREVLLSQFVGGLQSPLRNFLWAMKGVAQGMVRALAEIGEQKKAEEEGKA